MQSIILSIYFFITFLIFFAGLIAFKKTDKSINIVLSVPIYIMIYILYNAFVAGIINIIRIPINLLSIGIVDLITGLLLFFFSYRKKTFQKYNFNYKDLIAYGAFFIVTLALAVVQFGTSLIPNYITTDPSRHLQMAQEVISNQNISGMYFSKLLNALFLSFFGPFFPSFWQYKLFILSDICMLFLSSILFYSLVRKFAKNNLQIITTAIFTLIYICGYPLNNMVFGFVYLGMGVSITAYLIYTANMYFNESICPFCSVVALMLGAYGLIICYSLFVPTIYVSVALFIAYKFFKKKKLISFNFFITELEVFLIPVILGAYYSFLGTFGDVTVSTAISTEGYIYRNIYSDFIFIMPLLIYGFIKGIAEKKIYTQHISFVIVFAFIAVLLVGGMKGKVSSYYYFKNYYLMSLICYIIGSESACRLLEKSKTVFISYMASWFMFLGMFFTKIDAKIGEKNILFSPNSTPAFAFEIYNFNRTQMSTRHFPIEKLTLYENAYQYKEGDRKVGLLDTLEPTYWYEALTDQQLSDYYINELTDENAKDFINKLKNSCDYIVVPEEQSKIIADYAEEFSVVYENTAGIVYRVNG